MCAYFCLYFFYFFSKIGLAEMTTEEKKHMLAKEKFKAQQEKEKQLGKKKAGHGGRRR